MKNNRGVVLAIVIIFTLVVSIVAAGALILMTSQARLTEGHIKRLKAYFASQASINRNLMLAIQGDAPLVDPFPEGAADNIIVTFSENVGAGPDGTDEWTIDTQY